MCFGPFANAISRVVMAFFSEGKGVFLTLELAGVVRFLHKLLSGGGGGLISSQPGMFGSEKAEGFALCKGTYL